MKNFISIVVLGAVLLGPALPASADEQSNKIIKQGLLGAGVGAISASASGGKAGKGALIGAGTSVIGGALLDSLMPSQPAQPQQVQYVQAPPPQYAPQPQYQDQSYQEPNEASEEEQDPNSYATQSSSSQPKKHVIRKYDKDGNVISEEEIWE